MGAARFPRQTERGLIMTAKLITMCAVLHMPGPDPDDAGRYCVGHCPACHQPVWDADEPVWTCPANLHDENPHRADSYVSAALQEREGCYSNCADDFGLGCPHDPMPLHDACYGSNDITY